MLSGDSLVFHLTARQKRTQRIIAAVLAPAALALAGAGIAAGKYVIGYVLMLAAAGALAAACMGLNNARAFTECTPSSLRARTVLGRLREWPWPQVADISVKEVTGRGTYSAVMVTTTAGRRTRLAAPTSGIVTPEEFTASAKQIQDYWRAATAATGPPERTVSGGGARSRDRSAGPAMAATARRSPARRLLARAAIAAAAVVAAVVLAITLFEGVQAWAVHFGLGQRGSFTSVSQDCSYRGVCMWTGTFSSDNGSAIYGVTFEDGGHPGTAGAAGIPATYLWGSAYPQGGGSNWAAYAIVDVLEILAVIGGVRFWLRRRARRRAADPAAGTGTHPSG